MPGINRYELKKFIASWLAEQSDEQLQNRTIAITLLSVQLQKKYPAMMRESRRVIAARHIMCELNNRMKARP